MRSIALILGLVLVIPCAAQARNVEPGATWGRLGFGPAIKLGSVAVSGSYVLISPELEYAFSKRFGATFGLSVGVADVVPARLRIGGKLRMVDLELPLSPYAQASLSVGGFFGNGGRRGYIGVTPGVGIDYFLTQTLLAGLSLSTDLGTTFSGEFLGLFEVLFYAAYRF